MKLKISSVVLVVAALLLSLITETNGLASPNDASSRRDFFHQVNVAATSALTVTASSTVIFSEAARAESEAGPLAGQIDFPPLGLGAWSWGDSLFWQYDKKNDKDLQQVFDYALENSRYPKTLIDTAELYGLGRSEELIGQFASQYPADKIQICSKFAALPFRTNAKDVVKACEASVQRLGGRPIDLYQIHFPNAWSNTEYWDGLATCFDKGLVKAVGVSNYGVEATRACHDALAKRGIQLASNQIQLSLLYQHPVNNGLLQACDDLGVKVLSYSPLALGMLAGKYTPENPPSGPRKAVYEKLSKTPAYATLLSTMREIASGHNDATPAQVAINWARAKNTIPIPGARTLSQVKQNYAALDWSLSKEEEKVLDKVASKVQAFVQPSDSPFFKKDINTGMVMFDS